MLLCPRVPPGDPPLLAAHLRDCLHLLHHKRILGGELRHHLFHNFFDDLRRGGREGWQGCTVGRSCRHAATPCGLHSAACSAAQVRWVVACSPTFGRVGPLTRSPVTSGVLPAAKRSTRLSPGPGLGARLRLGLAAAAPPALAWLMLAAQPDQFACSIAAACSRSVSSAPAQRVGAGAQATGEMGGQCCAFVVELTRASLTSVPLVSCRARSHAAHPASLLRPAPSITSAAAHGGRSAAGTRQAVALPALRARPPALRACPHPRAPCIPLSSGRASTRRTSTSWLYRQSGIAWCAASGCEPAYHSYRVPSLRFIGWPALPTSGITACASGTVSRKRAKRSVGSPACCAFPARCLRSKPGGRRVGK